MLGMPPMGTSSASEMGCWVIAAAGGMLEAALPLASCDLTVAAENMGRWTLSSPASSAYNIFDCKSSTTDVALAQPEVMYTTR